jgi:hypothetical protein
MRTNLKSCSCENFTELNDRKNLRLFYSFSFLMEAMNDEGNANGIISFKRLGENEALFWYDRVEKREF